MAQDEDIPSQKVGIIGTGFGSVVHFPSYQKHTDFEPIAIAGMHESKTATIAKRLSIDNYYTNWREMIQSDEIDVVSIVTPPDLHHEMTLAALDEGKHVLCEKPLSTNLAHAQEMYNRAEESGLIAMVDLVFRYIPSRAYLLELIKNNYIGDIYQLDITVRNSSRLNPRTRGYNWWSSKKRGGGVLNALGTHYIDFLLQVFGSINKVSGKLSTHIPKRLNKLSGRMKKVSADDAFVSILDVGRDCLSSINISTTTSYGRGPKIEVYGSEGALMMVEDQTIFGGKLGEQDKMEKITIPESLKLNLSESSNHMLVPPFSRLLDEFAKGIKTGRSLHPNFEDAIEIQKVLDAIRESSNTSSWVKID